MSFTTDNANPISLSFKTLINKEFTTTAKQFYEEFGANTINTNFTEVWSSEVSSTPATAVNAGVATLYQDFELSPLTGFTTSVFYFVSGSGFTPGTNISRGSINEDLLQRNFISTKYGAGYEIVLKQNDGTVVPATDNSNWFWNYQTGILSVTNPGGHSLPYKVDVYQYTGLFLSQSLDGGSGFPFAGAAVISGSLLISSSAAEEPALKIEGSTELVGSLDVEGVAASLLDGQVDATSSITVTAAAPTSNNRYASQSPANVYYLDGIEAPYIRFFPGKSYIFDWSGATSHPVAFYLDAAKNTQYTTGVSTPASNQTQIDVTENTPSILYYMCTAHPYMGNAAHMESSAVSASLAQTASYVAGANVDGAVATASYVAGADVDGAVANATNAAAAATLSAGATGTDLTLSGNLSVAGTASFTNATNLSVKDKYILLASGSAAASDGGIAVEQAADGKSKLFAYDSAENRWAVTSSFDPLTAAGYDPDAYMPLIISGSIIADIPASYNQEGNMFVDSSNDSWIYTDKWSKIIVSGSAASFSGLTVDGNASVTGTLGLGDITDVSASIAALDADPGGVFVQTGSKFNTTNDLEITGSLIVSSSTAIPIQASGQSINIGAPVDGGYTDGFFDQFTSATSLANAIDEISEAFLDLAPAKAGALGGTSLVLSLGPTNEYSGLLAYGLNSDHWYQNGYSAGQSAPFVKNGTFNLLTADTTTRFRAGKNSDLDANTLEGGVTASVKFRNAAATLTTRALDPDGQGTTAPLNITSLAQYNTFWVKANAQIEQSLGANDTGSYQYKILADNGAGETNAKNLMWVGSSTHYPNPTVTPGTVTSGSVTYNFLSGIRYLKTATFTVPGQAGNMFNPVYQVDNVRWNSSYWSGSPLGGTTGADTPNFDDTLSFTKNLDLAAGTNSGQSAPTATITVFKPGNLSTNSSAFDLSHTPVNSYVSAQSTAKIEHFLDEDKRVESDYSTSWTSNSALTDGNLQVQNGRLVTGNTGDYSGFTATNNYYFRKFTGFSIGQTSGTFAMNTGTNVFASLSEWGSGTGIQAILIDEDDISAGGVPSKVYDLGKAQANPAIPPTVAVPGNANANHFGIKKGTVGPLSGEYSFGTNGTLGASGNMILVINIKDPNATNQLNQITLS